MARRVRSKMSGCGMESRRVAGLVLLIGVLTSHPAAASAARSPYLHSSKPTGQEADWPEADRVSDLPGASNFSENYPVMYSGYLHLGGDPRRLMFYSLVLKSGKNETSDDSENIIMWTNGGPGCSGLLGMFAEQGPMRPQPGNDSDELELRPNDWSWHHLSSMLFLEQPLFTGFSFSDYVEDKSVGDDLAAKQMREALIAFRKKFPMYSDWPFVLASESYGGKYIPHLAAEIQKRNEEGSDEHIKISKLLIGNPYVGPEENDWGIYAALYGHGIAPEWTYSKWRRDCADLHPREKSLGCIALERSMKKARAYVNPYALDYPICESGSGLALTQQRQKAGQTLATRMGGSGASQIKDDGDDQESWLPSPRKPAPCTESWVPQYLNRLDVQKALHVERRTSWETCASDKVLFYNETEMLVNTAPLYKQVVDHANGTLPVLVFSGDDDSVCAPHGTMRWMYAFNGWEVRSDWRPWFAQPRESWQQRLGGYEVRFNKGVTFATIHFAGHEAPLFQPERAYALVRAFLNGYWFT